LGALLREKPARLDPGPGAAALSEVIARAAERILTDGKEFAIGGDVRSLLRHRADAVAGRQRSGGHGPRGEIRPG
jgi:hypothetical protein